MYKNFKLKIYCIRVGTVAVGTKNETVFLSERKLFQVEVCEEFVKMHVTVLRSIKAYV